LGNRFRVAGTAELAGENYDICRKELNFLLKWVHTNFPILIQLIRLVGHVLVDDLHGTFVKQSKKNSKVFYHTGHGHLGWTLSSASKMLVSLIDNS